MLAGSPGKPFIVLIFTERRLFLDCCCRVVDGDAPPPAFGAEQNMFAVHGDLAHVKVVYDRSTGKSMGYGFVKFTTNEAAAAATVAINGMAIDRKRIKVRGESRGGLRGVWYHGCGGWRGEKERRQQAGLPSQFHSLWGLLMNCVVAVAQ